MTDCKGLFGKWFGHSFRKFLLKKAFVNSLGDTYKIHGDSVMQFVEAQRDIYVIRCKRCGMRLD